MNESSGSPLAKYHVIPHFISSTILYFRAPSSVQSTRPYHRGVTIMPPTPLLLTLLFLITLPIRPVASIARGHLTPSALGFPVALSFIPRSAFTTPTPRSWEVARALQALVTVWVGMGAVRGMKRTWRRIRGGSARLNEPAGMGAFPFSRWIRADR